MTETSKNGGVKTTQQKETVINKSLEIHGKPKNFKREKKFRKFSPKVLADFKRRLQELEQLEDETILTLFRSILVGNEIDGVERETLTIEQVKALYPKHRALFQDQHDRKQMEYFLHDFCPKIKAAYERIENETYGFCSVTERRIPVARLKVWPLATLRMEGKEAKTKPAPVLKTPTVKDQNWYEPELPRVSFSSLY